MPLSIDAAGGPYILSPSRGIYGIGGAGWVRPSGGPGRPIGALTRRSADPWQADIRHGREVSGSHARCVPERIVTAVCVLSGRGLSDVANAAQMSSAISVATPSSSCTFCHYAGHAAQPRGAAALKLKPCTPAVDIWHSASASGGFARWI
ncbi:hypothetical protein AcW1_005835 [Taiwanofungus camphoratus]|nr:hypothetical protein AcW1_005835 [Antrodia cinnamomea]